MRLVAGAKEVLGSGLLHSISSSTIWPVVRFIHNMADMDCSILHAIPLYITVIKGQQ